MMKTVIRTAAAAAALAATASAEAVVLDVDFNGNRFQLETFESAETGAEFYNWGAGAGSGLWHNSANPYYPGTTTLIPLEDHTLHVFSHVDTTTGLLSFGIILGAPDAIPAGGSRTFSADVDWSAPATLALVDDAGETGTPGAGGPQSLSFRWYDCCTDGFVISGFDPHDLSIELTNVTGTNLNQVVFLSPDGALRNRIFRFPANGFGIRVTSVPEPGPALLLGLALAGLGYRAGRRRFAG